MKHHKCEQLSGELKVLIDKHVYCERHRQELVKFHCKDCKELICILCNGTEHKSHDAETIDEAVQKLLPVFKENTKQLEDIVKTNEADLEYSTVKGQALKKRFEDMEKQIDGKCKEMIREIRDDCKQVKKQLKDIKDEKCGKLEAYRKKLEAKIQSQKNMVLVKTTAVVSAQGTSLLRIIEWGDTINGGHIQITNDKVEMSDAEYEVDFVETVSTELNLIGNVGTKAVMKTHGRSDWINSSLTDLTKGKATLASEINPIQNCVKFVKVNNELMFSKHNTNTLDIYSLDGNKLRSVTYADVGSIQSVSTLESSLVLAANNGLFIADSNGNVESKVLEGNICDASIIDNVLFLLDNDTPKPKIHILKMNEDKMGHIKKGEFTITNSSGKSFNTVQATNKFIYVAHYGDHKIVQYDYAGVPQITYTTAKGQSLPYPKLCAIDKDGSLLIVRHYEENKVMVLTKDGQWHALSVTGIANPQGAFVEDDILWVYDWNAQKCMQFRFD